MWLKPVKVVRVEALPRESGVYDKPVIGCGATNDQPAGKFRIQKSAGSLKLGVVLEATPFVLG